MGKSLKDMARGGKWVKMQAGDSEVFTLACDPNELESVKSRFGDVIEVLLTDSEGEEKIFNVKSAKVASQLSQFEEGDKIRIAKIESDDGKGRWKISAAKKKQVDEDEEEEEVDEEEETPKKKKAKDEDEEEEEELEDEEEEEEAPKKKKSKKVEDEESDDDFDELDEEEEEEEPAPKKKKKKSKK